MFLEEDPLPLLDEPAPDLFGFLASDCDVTMDICDAKASASIKQLGFLSLSIIISEIDCT